MRRYFAREPRLSREEIERQAQEAIDARVSMGRPPEEEFRPLHERLAEIDRAVATRRWEEPVPERQPLQIHQVQVPAPATAPQAPAERPRAAKVTVGSTGHSAN